MNERNDMLEPIGSPPDGPPDERPHPLWLSLLHTTAMLLVGLALPGAPLAALCLYFEGTLDWPEAVQAGCWLIALVAVLGTALWVAASQLDRRA